MKKLFLATLVAIITAGMAASAVSAEPGKGKGLEKSPGKAYGLDRKPVCHNGKTLYLPAPALAAHDRHGDELGECENVQTPLGEGVGDGGKDSASPDTITMQGTLTLESGDPALKTSKGTLRLEAKSAKGEKRLEALAKKGEKVKVTGKKSGKTLEVSQLKTTKGKKK